MKNETKTRLDKAYNSHLEALINGSENDQNQTWIKFNKLRTKLTDMLAACKKDAAEADAKLKEYRDKLNELCNVHSDASYALEIIWKNLQIAVADSDKTVLEFLDEAKDKTNAQNKPLRLVDAWIKVKMAEAKYSDTFEPRDMVEMYQMEAYFRAAAGYSLVR